MRVTAKNNSSRIIKVNKPDGHCFLNPGAETSFDAEGEDDFSIATIREATAYYCGQGDHTLIVDVVDGHSPFERV